MACSHPIPASRGEFGGVALARRRDLHAHDQDWGTDPRHLLLPCGTCINCRMSRAREWAFRCQLELTQHSQAAWVTLTYDNRHLPPTLRKDHLSSFLKRLRARVHPNRVRFFASGEYGERRGRPHYHAILYGVSDTPHLQASWALGRVYAFPVTPALIAYTAGYTAKKIGVQERSEERIDYSTGEIYQYQPPFLQMSRNPGIASHARQFWTSWRDHAISNGNPIPAPRYLHQSWVDNASPSQLTQLQEEKLSVIRPTKSQLLAAEKIALSRYSLQKETRSLE